VDEKDGAQGIEELLVRDELGAARILVDEKDELLVRDELGAARDLGAELGAIGGQWRVLGDEGGKEEPEERRQARVAGVSWRGSRRRRAKLTRRRRMGGRYGEPGVQSPKERGRFYRGRAGRAVDRGRTRRAWAPMVAIMALLQGSSHPLPTSCPDRGINVLVADRGSAIARQLGPVATSPNSARGTTRRRRGHHTLVERGGGWMALATLCMALGQLVLSLWCLVAPQGGGLGVATLGPRRGQARAPAVMAGNHVILDRGGAGPHGVDGSRGASSLRGFALTSVGRQAVIVEAPCTQMASVACSVYLGGPGLWGSSQLVTLCPPECCSVVTPRHLAVSPVVAPPFHGVAHSPCPPAWGREGEENLVVASTHCSPLGVDWDGEVVSAGGNQAVMGGRARDGSSHVPCCPGKPHHQSRADNLWLLPLPGHA
jgi:hypothetical protein